MRITVINGTETKGVTYRLKEIFLDGLRDGAEITEFYLPRDCPNFCAGCKACFLRGEKNCKDAQYIQKIEKAMHEADLLVFTTPVYVYHASGAMKVFLDHFGYRWMPHRPAAEMFGKRAVIITQCLGGGSKSTVKDIKDSLSWWGISSIRVCAFKLMSEINWDKIPDKKRNSMAAKLRATAAKCRAVDYSRPSHTNIGVKAKFLICRMLQKNLGKTDPEYYDYKYWKEKGWTGKARPWIENRPFDRL